MATKDCKNCPYKIQATFKKPTIAEIDAFAKEIGYQPFDAEQFFYYNDARGWQDNKGRPYKIWKSVVQTWRKAAERRGDIKPPQKTFVERMRENEGQI